MIMHVEEIHSGSHDGRGAGDHDTPFEFGHPRSCLTIREQGWLTILRVDIKNVLLGEPVHGLTADDDLKGESSP